MSREPITPEEVKHLEEAGEAVVLLDARNEEAWRKSEWQLPHARRFPPTAVEVHLDEIPLGALIVPYAGSAEEAESVARALAGYGWTNVRPLLGGPDAWRRAGFPTESMPGRKLTVSEAQANLQKAEGE
jgi:rhodanese-related sulfurtransferase